MRQITNLITIICLSLLACACTSSTYVPPTRTATNATDATLAEAAASVSRSLVGLAEAEQAAHPLPIEKTPPLAASYGMQAKSAIDWSGPIQPIVKQIASDAGYQLKVVGTPPAIPVLITISAKNTMLADILRNIGFQAGKRANIVIFPTQRTIELHYAKN